MGWSEHVDPDMRFEVYAVYPLVPLAPKGSELMVLAPPTLSLFSFLLRSEKQGVFRQQDDGGSEVG